jgi:asparagine synthase (glutamine-hydrolysing)
MSEFLIDCRSIAHCNAHKAANLMKYYADLNVQVFEFDTFRLVLSRPDDLGVWGPCNSIDGKLFVAIVGRIALEADEWAKAKSLPGNGGLACKAISIMYLQGGIKKLENLNGNFVVLVYDSPSQQLHIITDRCGMNPCYASSLKDDNFVFSSHPDILANALNLSQDWDLVSITEFLATGKLSYPHSYYNSIKALDYGSIYTIDFIDNKIKYRMKKYFDFNFNIEHNMSEWDLAEELACSFRKSINRRTLPLFGQTGVSLSGGLDSRALLCSASDKRNIWAFCFFDEENLEYKIAREIAQVTGVKFISLKRDFDHYGDNAEAGVKISGAMGDFGSNHYLGFRDSFRKLGIENIIAGFYCDYLFKSLVLNKHVNKFLRTEKFTKFQYANYMPVYWFDTVYSHRAKDRLDELFPDNVKNNETDRGRLEIEKRRLFPLCNEPDNQETLIPQRVMGWYLPIVDNDIIDTYLKIPPKYKLNTSMYSKMVELQCGEKISRVTNINTGTRVNASHLDLIVHGYRKSIQSKIKKRKKSIATNESWPNWAYYLCNSKKIEALWMKKNETANDIFKQIMGKDPYEKNIHEYKSDGDLKLFLRLLTIKMWFDQRI